MVLPQCPNISIKIHVYSDVEKMEKTTEFRNFTCWQAGRGPVDCSTCPINHIWSCIWAPSTMWPRWGSQNEEFADQSKNLRHFSTLSCPTPCRAKVACFYFPLKLFFTVYFAEAACLTLTTIQFFLADIKPGPALCCLGDICTWNHLIARFISICRQVEQVRKAWQLILLPSSLWNLKTQCFAIASCAVQQFFGPSSFWELCKPNKF